MCAAGAARAADLCPPPPARAPKVVKDAHADLSFEGEPRPADESPDQRVHIESDNASVGEDGQAELSGSVVMRQGERSLAADALHYDRNTGKADVRGKVEFEDPQLRLRGNDGTFDTAGNALVHGGSFEFLDRQGRGTAEQISLSNAGQLDLGVVRYTTCPANNRDWLLKAKNLHLDTAKQEGSGHNVLLRVKDVPIFYTPYISFPLGDARKSGFLFPTFGNSSRSGLEFGLPYYFNLAPNYDLTLEPGLHEQRGAYLGDHFRYLTERSHGDLEGNYLPDDSKTGFTRAYTHLKSVTDFRSDMRLDVDAAGVSDTNYFEDFALGSEATSVTFLERRADFLYQTGNVRVRTQLQNFQTIDREIADFNRPYSRVPRIDARGVWPLGGGRFSFDVDGEAVNFLRDDGVNGLRVDVEPELHYSQRGAAYFIEPAVGWRYTQYDLRDEAPGTQRSPSRELPFARFDTGLVFERVSGSHGQRVQTLEPELVYTYVPYRNQNDLPIFDTGLPDLNLAELFRTNRYVGADRVSDANQVSAGVTTRLYEQSTGAQYLSATLGQTRYFKTPRVALPGEEDSKGSASNLVAQLVLTAYKNWNLNFEHEWSPSQDEFERSETVLQYKLDPTRVVNVGYRYRRGLLEQWDTSFGWPLGPHWDLVGRYVYSARDKQTIEQVAGFEYKSCCWRVQLIHRRYVSSRTGQLDHSIALQLQLVGLSSVGKSSDTFLERSIRGYSTRTTAP